MATVVVGSQKFDQIDSTGPIETIEKSTAEKAAELFHLRTDGMVELTTLISSLIIVKQSVSDLPDSVWESIQNAPARLGVQNTHEKDFEVDQREAFELVETYIANRKDPSIRFLYSVQALGNIFINSDKHPSHIQTIIKITEQCLRVLSAKQINTVNEQNRADVLIGLKVAYRNNTHPTEFTKMLKSHFDDLFMTHISG